MAATAPHFDIGKHATDVDLTEQFYDLIGEPGETGDTFATFHTPGHHETDTETIGGGQTGFNFQFGHFVVGAEGSFIGNGSTAGGKFHAFQENELFLTTEGQNVTAETDFGLRRMVETTWNGFVGGHIGFYWNRLLFYVSAQASRLQMRRTIERSLDRVRDKVSLAKLSAGKCIPRETS